MFALLIETVKKEKVFITSDRHNVNRRAIKRFLIEKYYCEERELSSLEICFDTCTFKCNSEDYGVIEGSFREIELSTC